MTFGRLLHQVIHPLKALPSKSVIISNFFGHTHRHHNLGFLHALTSLPRQKRILPEFQNSDRVSFTTHLKGKLITDFPVIRHDNLIWKYTKSFWTRECNPKLFEG